MMKCRYIDKDNNCTRTECGGKCDDISGCYFKQLQRLKKEYNNLREAMHKDFCSHYVLGECSQEHHVNCVGRNQCIKDLEKENEGLKSLLDFETQKSETYQQENEELKDKVERLDKMTGIFSARLAKKYEQSLEEIKEIAEENKDTAQYSGICRSILTKIDEVMR